MIENNSKRNFQAWESCWQLRDIHCPCSRILQALVVIHSFLSFSQDLQILRIWVCVRLYCGSWGKMHFIQRDWPLCSRWCEKDLSLSLTFVLMWNHPGGAPALWLWENGAAVPSVVKYKSWNQGYAWELILNVKTYWSSQLFFGSLSPILEFLQPFCKASPWCVVCNRSTRK